MAKLDLFLVNCWKDGLVLVQDCHACDWRDLLPIDDPIGKVTCGMTGEVFPIIHRVVEIDADIHI